MSKQYFMYSEGGSFAPKNTVHPEAIEFLIIDLFCGAGGTTTGFNNAMIDGKKVALIMACVNHDPKAIESHWLNHPEVIHFEEDIRTLKLSGLADIVFKYRLMYPNAKIILWASLECTNFSKAKGGQPRDADSRTLAEGLYSVYDPETKTYHSGDSYIQILNPDYIMIENVVEFMSWGPMRIACKKSHKTHSELKFIINKKTGLEEYAWIPESKKNGQDFMKWKETVCSLGYRDDWREINSADFGAYTSRNRLFGCFAKDGLPIVWPDATHAKKPIAGGLFNSLQKWKPVKDVLDFEDEGKSIFNRKIPLVDASLDRIYAGLIKFVAGGQDAFMVKYNSMNQKGKYKAPDMEEPCPVVSTQGRLGMCFIAKYYSGKPAGKVIPVTGPAGTIKTSDGQSLVTCMPFILDTSFKNVGSSIEEPAKTLMASRHHPYILNPVFLAKYNSTGDNVSSVEDPAGTLTCGDRFSKIQPVFLDKTGNANLASIDDPAGTVMPNDKHSIINCQPFILNPSHGGHCTGTSVPCVTIIARQDKAPLYLIQFDLDENVNIPVYEDDTESMIKIKKFMALYGLSDIKMRMLKVSELILIQGLIDSQGRPIKLAGNETDKKKFIGNSVHPLVPEHMAIAKARKLRHLREQAA